MKLKLFNMTFFQQNFTRLTAVAILVTAFASWSCNKTPIGPTGPDPIGPPVAGQYITLTAFRALYPGAGDFTIPAGTKKFRGVVVSNSANEAAGNYRLQDESGSGVILYSVVGSPVYPLGSILEVDAAGSGMLNLYNGDLELRSVPQAKVVPISGSITLTPRSATVAQIITNRDAWASTLVKITGITSISQASTNATGTTYNVTDATGTLSMFVRVAAGITVNTSATSITGYVSLYNTTTQVGIRSASDLQ